MYVSLARNAKNAGMAAQRARDFLVPSLGQIPIGALGPNDIRAYRLLLEAGKSAPRTVRHLLTDLRCLLHWSVEAGLVARTPFPRRIMPRIQESPPDRLQADEVRAVLAIGEPHAFIIRFALETGLRWAEMCRARREHVENGMLTVSRTKSGKVRRVPLNAHFEAELRARGPGRFVLFTEGSAGSFNKVVRRRSGVERFHVHQLRHTFACTWLERGGSLPALQQILGHASVTTTQQYARLSDDSVRSEAARVNGSRIADWRLPASEGSHDQDGSVSRTAVPMSLK